MAFVGAFNGGNNPRYGRDAGAVPPYPPAYYANGQLAVPMGQGPYTAMYPGAAGVGYAMQYPQAYGLPQYVAPGPTAGAYQYYNTGGAAAGMRLPQAHPGIDPHMPAANMTNSTGGVGCEPGYNYFFPPEHTKIHVLKTGAEAPWQLPPHAVVAFSACHVPVNTTLSELLKGFGATNPAAKKNRCWEVSQGGNGKWYKGLCISGDEKDMMKKTIKDLGWDSTRTGRPGEKPVVYLYVTRN